MAASSSQQTRNVKVPQNSVKANRQGTSKKGKGKERSLVPPESSCVEGMSEGSYNTATSAWNWTSLTDSSASKHPPIFTKDGSYFFSIVGSSVKIYSTTTGQVLSTLYGPARETTSVSDTSFPDDISSATLNPHNAYQLITGSLNGYIMVWDFLDGVLLQTIDIGQPILHICAHEKFKDFVFVAACRRINDDNSAILRVSLKPSNATAGSRVHASSDVSAIGKTKSLAGLAFSSSGAWLVAIGGQKVFVATTASFKSGFVKYVSSEKLTCLAFHPSEEYFATGDVKGNIRLWYCLNEDIALNATGVEKKTQTMSYHWHAHAVSSLAFTPNGAYLLSGGEEAVLVIWQLHTGKKEFVPRVGAPIENVTSCKVGDEEEYLLGLSDATYTFVSAKDLKISRSYSRIKLDQSSHVTPSFTPLAVHSLSSTLVIPSSHPSSLQIYSPSSSKLISELEISPSNRVSRRDEKPLQPARVEHIVISSFGDWMATIDERDGDDGFRGEIYLKIWRWNPKTSYWELNTRIDRPHGLKKVSAVVFSPQVRGNNDLNLVTTGQDGNVKTWRIRRVKNKAGHSEEFWVSRSTFGFRSEIPTHASWSPDGSLLAISFGPYLTLYDSVTNVLRQSLTFPGCKIVKHAQFVGRSGRFLVVVGFRDLILWDLVKQCVRWHHKSQSSLENVVPHPLEDTFALFHSSTSPKPNDHQTQISLYRVLSPNPHQTHTVPFKLHNIIWCPLSRSSSSLSSSAFTLVGITGTWSVVLVGDEVQLPQQAGSSPTAIVGDHSVQQKTLFQDIFGKSAFANVSEATSPPSIPLSDGAHQSRSGKGLSSIFDRPTYLTPPLESLFDPLVGRFLKKWTGPDIGEVDETAEPEHANIDEDVDMEDEADTSVAVRTQTARAVDQDEMSIFVDLFKRHIGNVSASSSHHKIPTKTNGTPKPQSNGTAQHPTAVTPMSNGISPKRKTSLKKSATLPSKPSTVTVEIRATKGKRKKVDELPGNSSS